MPRASCWRIGPAGDNRAKYVGNLGPLYGSDVDWTGGFLKRLLGQLRRHRRALVCAAGPASTTSISAQSLPPDAPNDDAYVKVDQTLLEFARYPANIVHGQAEEWQGYQQRFPAMVDKNIFLSIDEYAYFGGGFGRPTTLKQSLAYGMIFNEMLRHTDFLTMAAHTTGVSTIDFNRTAATMNTLGLTFKMYSNNFVGAVPVALSGNSPQPAPKISARRRSAKDKLRQPHLSARHVCRALRRQKVPHRIRGERDRFRAEVRLERQRHAHRGTVDALAIDRQHRWTPPIASASRRRLKSRRFPSAALRDDLGRPHQRQHLSLSGGAGGAVKIRTPAETQAVDFMVPRGGT